jgi:RNase adaptor protein for sRNA GlmZ degradation
MALQKGLKFPQIEAVKTFDARHLQDPAGWNIGPDGIDERVKAFVRKQTEAKVLLHEIISYLDNAMLDDDLRQYPDVAIGCVGGIFRSVAMAEWVNEERELGVKHLGLELWRKQGIAVWEL